VAEPGIESSQVCGLIERSETENEVSGCIRDVSSVAISCGAATNFRCTGVWLGHPAVRS
jgi:hypothetical protein